VTQGESLSSSPSTTLTGVWKKLVLTRMDDFEGLKISVGKIAVDVMEIAKIRRGA
jgi:hypothetical protein